MIDAQEGFVGSCSALIGELYTRDSRRILATLIRLLGDFDLAEEAVQEAFAAALVQWPRDGIPDNPVSWLISTGRFKAIDRQRREAGFHLKIEKLAHDPPGGTHSMIDFPPEVLDDDHLRLIFTCCHPALSADARVALTLRTVGHLTTEEIARAFLMPVPTLAQRIVRAKNKITQAGIPYEVPEGAELAARLDAVLAVIYLIYNEGYSATEGTSLTRPDLSGEAIRLARLLTDLMPEPEANGLLAMMLLHESRRAARTDASGDIVLLDQQDRSVWDSALIDEGRRRAEMALRSGRAGRYAIQAAIAAVHADAARAADTDWTEITGLYEVLMQIAPSPVVQLNRGVAVAMCGALEDGLRIVDEVLALRELTNYQPAHAARADLLRRLGRTQAARAAYETALKLTQQKPEQRYLSRRLTELS